MNSIQKAEDALSTAFANKHRTWAGAQKRYEKGDYFPVHHDAKFPLSNSETIFTIGSCFAREVEATLLKIGVPLAIDGYGVPPEFFETWNEEKGWGGGVPRGSLSRGALNKYCVHSMTHELRRVISGIQYPDAGLIEIEPGKWFDPHSSGLKRASFDDAMASRLRIQDAMMQIKKSSVVLLTLGLTESWIDTHTGIAMNTHPGGAFLKRAGDRFNFVDYDYSSIVAELDGLVSLIRKDCNPQMRFIMTVSPVPLAATFRSQDVVVANTASKSILRAAAHTMYKKYDFIDYFPSFEIVMNSPRALAWEEDQIHVKRLMVEHIMRTFQASYFPEIKSA